MNLLLTYKVFITTGWFVLVFIAERVFSAARLPEKLRNDGSSQRVFRNISLSIVNMVLSPLIIIPVTAYFSNYSMDWRPMWMQGGSWILLDIILLDGFLYLWHRLVHQWPPLWRFHQVHHLDEFLDSTSALRFHCGEVILAAIVRSLFAVILAIPITSIILFEIIVMIAVIFHHSNVRIPAALERSLSQIIVTPSIHWVHHHAKRKDTDSNYATIFSFWDRLFATRSRTQRTPELKIGVEGGAEQSLLNLFVLPFRE